MPASFNKIIVANRGEIACRIVKTARKLGIATVAVYSEADRAARHVALADEAFPIGPAPARESYLDGAKILEAARRAGADAIHPGYGFLAENADFAEGCAAAGLVFIGPSPSAMRAMGDKARAKSLMTGAGIPVVPGYHGPDQDPRHLADAAAAIGYPVLIKPSAGGGGKGMKIAASAEVFVAALDSAKREALASFGDDRILLEKYIAAPRHVEVQIFADSRGHIVHLFDRDCSIQRRHQKIIEEAPAPNLPDALRHAMRDAAIAAARSIGYTGAGTIEFLVARADGAFFFLEMNTRLQVEHPVTEMITGLDLVEWQILVAAGSPLPRGQDAIVATGHAIEARLYAEDPDRDFLPQAGILSHIDFPAETPHVRVETGVRARDAISIHYDPMIAKLVAHDEDRASAIRRLDHALAETRIMGVRTNLTFLRNVLTHAGVSTASPDTGFIGRHADALLGKAPRTSSEHLALAVIGLLCARKSEAQARAAHSSDPWSPWNARDGWRLNETAVAPIRLREISGPDRRDHVIEVGFLPGGWRLALPDGTLFSLVSGELEPDGTLRADLDGHRLSAAWLRSGAEIHVFLPGRAALGFALESPAARAEPAIGAPGRLTSPMPGRIAAFLVGPGSRVRENEPVLIIEAMKMEHMLRAPSSGTVREFKFALGDQVGEGVELVTFESDGP